MGKITKQELTDGLAAEINEKVSTSQLTTEMNKKANFSHTHSISNVTGLQAELDKAERVKFKVIKSGKDAEGAFTTLEYRRKSDNTLAAKSVLSGGTAPQYTTRTLTFYAANGTTVEKTETYTLSYDADGDLVSEV